jgi:hypothetical protein
LELLKQERVKCCFCEGRFHRHEIKPLPIMEGVGGGDIPLYVCRDRVACSDRMEQLEEPSGRRDWAPEQLIEVRIELFEMLTGEGL